MHRTLPLLLLFGFSIEAIAGTATGGIKQITLENSSSVILFTLDTPIRDTPRCNELEKFSIELQRPGGMAAYMALLEAKQHGYVLAVAGANVCSNYWKAEDVLRFDVQ